MPPRSSAENNQPSLRELVDAHTQVASYNDYYTKGDQATQLGRVFGIDLEQPTDFTEGSQPDAGLQQLAHAEKFNQAGLKLVETQQPTQVVELENVTVITPAIDTIDSFTAFLESTSKTDMLKQKMLEMKQRYVDPGLSKTPAELGPFPETASNLLNTVVKDLSRVALEGFTAAVEEGRSPEERAEHTARAEAALDHYGEILPHYERLNVGPTYLEGKSKRLRIVNAPIQKMLDRVDPNGDPFESWQAADVRTQLSAHTELGTLTEKQADGTLGDHIRNRNDQQE